MHGKIKYGHGKRGPVDPESDKKPKLKLSAVWHEARDLVWSRRGRLSLGFLVMLFNRLIGFIPVFYIRPIVDDILQKKTDAGLPLIAGAIVYDGLGNAGRELDVGIKADRK